MKLIPVPGRNVPGNLVNPMGFGGFVYGAFGKIPVAIVGSGLSGDKGQGNSLHILVIALSVKVAPFHVDTLSAEFSMFRLYCVVRLIQEARQINISKAISAT
jgi:hypothetical protein